MVVDLLASSGSGPVWGIASADLNATLLVWPPGHVIAEHRNDERDVLLVTVEGSMDAVVGGRTHHLSRASALLIDKGTRRTLLAGPNGVRYLSIHLRRGPLQIEPAPQPE